MLEKIKHLPLSISVLQGNSVKILTETEVIQNLRKETNALKQKSQFLAYYSSILGGIVQDWHLAVLPADDHLVHR